MLYGIARGEAEEVMCSECTLSQLATPEALPVDHNSCPVAHPPCDESALWYICPVMNLCCDNERASLTCKNCSLS